AQKIFRGGMPLNSNGEIKVIKRNHAWAGGGQMFPFTASADRLRSHAEIFFSAIELSRGSRAKFMSPFNTGGRRKRHLFSTPSVDPGGGQKSGTFQSGTG